MDWNNIPYLLLFLYLSFSGLTFDIYEGQITALLGHSGAGKSTLMNILCGICPPTNGTATIYGSPVAEIADASEMKQLVGICPQFNIIFDVLTVEEHLRIFAAIKGIPRADIDAEVNVTIEMFPQCKVWNILTFIKVKTYIWNMTSNLPATPGLIDVKRWFVVLINQMCLNSTARRNLNSGCESWEEISFHL